MRSRPLNVLLLTIDAWRADFVDRFAGVALTPCLSRFTSRATRFSRAYATGPWTSPPILSMLTGQPPLSHGVAYEWSRLAPSTPALPALFAAAGYEVPALCYLARVGNYQHLGYRADEAPDYPSGPGDDLLPTALAALAQKEAPFFAWYHYKYVHLPYWADAEYRALFGVVEAEVPPVLRESVGRRFVVPRRDFPLDPMLRPWVQRMYAACVRQMDAFVGRVLETLAEQGRLDDTLVVLTADHGDEHLEHGHVGHASTSHQATLFEEVLRVPLWILDPRSSEGRQIDFPVWSCDLFPTLLSLAGVAHPMDPLRTAALDVSPWLGRCPPPTPPARTFVFHSACAGYQTPRADEARVTLALSDARHKFVLQQHAEQTLALYDLLADPQELHPRCEGADVERLHKELLACVADPGKQPPAPLL